MSTVNAKLNVQRIVEVLIGAGSTGETAFFSGLQQAVENAFDAQASNFEVTIDKKNDTLILSDNGDGFGPKQIDAFYSLYVSSKTDMEGLIGKNGSGRIFLLQVAKSLDVYTKSDHFPNLMNFSLSRGDLEALLSGNSNITSPLSINPPKWWNKKGNGSSIVLTGIDWKRVPGITKIISDFSQYLSPSIARMVTINEKPLKPRAVVGDVVEREFDHEKLGRIDVELFLPEKVKRGDATVLGAYNPIINLLDFARASSRPIPGELLSGSISGTIFIPKINSYRGHDGRSLDDAFYQSEIFEDVVEFFNNELNPIIKDAFARKQDAEKKAREEAALADISSSLREAFGDPSFGMSGNEPGKLKSKKNKPQKEDISISPSRVTLSPGDGLEIRVNGLISYTGNFEWSYDGDGSLSSNKGKSIYFTAGNTLGTSTLFVKDTKSGKTGQVPVVVVAHDNVSITPKMVEVYTGKKQVFRMKTRGANFKPEWHLPAGVEHELLDENKILVFSELPGKYHISLCHPDNGKELASSNFIVTTPPKEISNIISLEGVDYLLEVASLPVESVVEVLPGGKLNPIPNGPPVIDVLSVDLSHSIMTTTRHLTSSPDATLNALLPYLIGAHVRVQADNQCIDLMPCEYTQKVADIHRTILQARGRMKRSR